MKLTTTFGFAVLLGFTALMSIESHADKRVPYQTHGQLEAKCKAAGGTFDSSKADHFCQSKGNTVYCSKGNKKCISWGSGSKALPKVLPESLGETKTKKRPRVLQDNSNSSGGEPGNVKPTVLGSDNPLTAPGGDLQNINGNVQ